jgi:hypothetical protein
MEDFDYYTLQDVRVYLTLSGEFRAYIYSSPSLEAWGSTRDRAIMNLAQVLSKRDIPFAFDE